MDKNELSLVLETSGMTVEEMADKLGVREATVFKWQSGRKRIPDHYANIIKGWGTSEK